MLLIICCNKMYMYLPYICHCHTMFVTSHNKKLKLGLVFPEDETYWPEAPLMDDSISTFALQCAILRLPFSKSNQKLCKSHENGLDTPASGIAWQNQY